MQQQPDLPPTGDELGEDLYTSATADLSAGGVAMARGSAEEQDAAASTPPINDPTPAQIYAREDLVSQTERPTFITDYSGVDAAEDTSALSRIDPTWALAGGGLLALGGGIAGAWLYSRWQQERNRPINRLRRRARGMATVLSDRFEDLGERLPDVDEMRDTAPMGGGAVGALVVGLALARALHLGGWGAPQPTPSLAAATEAGKRWRRQLRGLEEIDVDAARKKIPNLDVRAAREKARTVDLKAARQRVPKVEAGSARSPMGLGLGGLLGIGAVGFLMWRLLRAGGSTQAQTNWYYGDERREEVPNQ